MAANAVDLRVFITDTLSSNEGSLPPRNCGRNAVSNIAPWFGLISSNMWEAVLMFVAYLATRWYQNLRSTAIFLQVYVLAVVAREAIVDFGRVSLRAIWWLQLAKYEHLKLPWSLAHQSGSELSGFLILAAVIPFLPIYPIAFALFVSYSFWRKCDVWDASLPIFWQKLGYCVYDVFLARYLLVHEDEVMGRNHRRKQSGEGHVPVSSSPANQGYFLEWTKELTRWYRLWKPRSFGTVIFYVIFFLLILPLTILLLTSTNFVTSVLLQVAVLSIAAVLVVCALVCFVALTGGHVTIVLAIGLEIVTCIQGVDLETDVHELRIWACFSIPLLILAQKLFLEKLIFAALAALRHDLGPDHRLSKSTRIYFEIPLDGAQIAVKISDCLTGNSPRASNRHSAFLVMSLHGENEALALV